MRITANHPNVIAMRERAARIAKKNGVALGIALDSIAQCAGFANWRALLRRVRNQHHARLEYAK